MTFCIEKNDNEPWNQNECDYSLVMIIMQFIEWRNARENKLSNVEWNE